MRSIKSFTAVFYGSAQTTRVVSQIYRGLSQSGKTKVIKSDQTDWIVPFVSVILSNLQLNEMKWGTTFRNTE